MAVTRNFTELEKRDLRRVFRELLFESGYDSAFDPPIVDILEAAASAALSPGGAQEFFVGTLAERDAMTPTPPADGTFFFVTDNEKLFRWKQSIVSWVEYTPSGGELSGTASTSNDETVVILTVPAIANGKVVVLDLTVAGHSSNGFFSANRRITAGVVLNFPVMQQNQVIGTDNNGLGVGPPAISAAFVGNELQISITGPGDSLPVQWTAKARQTSN
jgi:hypothetical protein